MTPDEPVTSAPPTGDPGAPRRVRRRLRAAVTTVGTLSIGAVVGVAATLVTPQATGSAPSAGSAVPVTDVVLAADETFEIGLQEPTDPGPFPSSVVPEGDTITIAGQRDGESTFDIVEYPQVQPLVPGEMDFEHYHTGIEIEWWMKKWAFDHPDLVDLYIVGESYSGTPIYQLTITDKSTGSDTDKPASYFEGNRHSGEISSAESSLWLIDHLLSSAGEDDDVDTMLDEKAVYVRPVNNPDGHDLYLYTAQTNRSTVRPYDNDGDGLLDEDPGVDLNEDGYLTQMRQFVGEGNGTHVVDDRDPAGRVMRSVGAGNGEYLVFSEGVDADGDGRIAEDGIGGLDLHRNYPYNWHVMPEDDATDRNFTQGGAGEYPLSEPETRHVYDFLMRHTNVSVVNSMDTRVPMHLRGPSTCDPEECMYDTDRELYEEFDEAGIGFTGYPLAGSVYIDYATRNGGEPTALFGHGPDFGYFQYGSIWYGDELWNNGNFIDYDESGTFSDWERSRWCFENDRDDCFLEWDAVEHPDLGEVEVGGINPKFWSQNSAPDLIEDVAANQAMFNLYMTEELPQVEITRLRSRPLGRVQPDGATNELVVTVTNSGSIPTALEQAQEVKIVRPDTFEVDGAEVVGDEPEFHLGGNETRQFTIRVAQEDGSTEATVDLVSVRGGLDSDSVVLR